MIASKMYLFVLMVLEVLDFGRDDADDFIANPPEIVPSSQSSLGSQIGTVFGEPESERKKPKLSGKSCFKNLL